MTLNLFLAVLTGVVTFAGLLYTLWPLTNPPPRRWPFMGQPLTLLDAQPGDVVIFKRGNSSWQGHVAFFVKDRGALIDVLGGNQSNAVNVKGYQSAALLGIRRPPKATAKPAKPAKRPAQIAKPAAQPSPAKPGSGAVAALLGGALVLIGAKIDAITAWASEWAHWAASFFN